VSSFVAASTIAELQRKFHFDTAPRPIFPPVPDFTPTVEAKRLAESMFRMREAALMRTAEVERSAARWQDAVFCPQDEDEDEEGEEELDEDDEMVTDENGMNVSNTVCGFSSVFRLDRLARNLRRIHRYRKLTGGAFLYSKKMTFDVLVTDYRCECVVKMVEGRRAVMVNNDRNRFH
jgi:hypothetical protein